MGQVGSRRLLGVLRELGFHVRLKVVSADSYFTVIGNRSTSNLDTGWGNWFADYAHPNDWFQPLLAGARASCRPTTATSRRPTSPR